MLGTRQTIFLSFFLSFFLCTSSSNRFFFFDFSHCESTNKIVIRFLSFSDGILVFPHELAWRRQLTLRTIDTSVCYEISQPNDSSDFSYFWFRTCFCFTSRGPIGQSVSSLQIGRLLLGAAYQFIHPY